ncbi:pyridoxal phosphate-dependent aminotransferase [Thermovenabulum gondwanense]|uniref:Aminotransferase n=1 Tax=Thermovenabulum gondwanense TaxID=520767 RepID=A0A162MJD8_9FIRM|nr:aminotransferase class I/II-fold pyridoxal phosphate-dependent enzyme [Thermovenabulum gondwanense]KYO66357.1 putative N-acetyl-LL-diaminopimelate aminotransferase [Thermovenabulum gondwanense]
MDYEKYVSTKVKQVEFSTIRHFFNLVYQMPDAISLCIGEPDFSTPLHIRESAKVALDSYNLGYTPNPGLPELRKAISEYLEVRFGLKYRPDTEIIVTIGASEAIDIALRTIINPGDEVLIPVPSFIAYKPCTQLAEGVPVFVPTYFEDEFKLKKDVLEKYITKNTKALILPYPNNPTGAVLTKKDLEEIAEVVEKYDLLVISDEVYAELTYEQDHIPFAAIMGMRERTITINGFSKSFSMTGWRLGFIAAPGGLAREILKVHQYSVTCASTISQFAGIEALKHGKKDVEEMRGEYDRRRKFLFNSLINLGFDCIEPKGAFYIFPSIKKFGISDTEFAERLLKEEKLAVVPGSAFGDGGEGFIRIAYSTSMENLKEAVIRIEKFINGLK